VLLVIFVSFLVAFLGAAPPKTVQTQPYVVTSSIAVAGMSYTAACLVLIAALLVWVSIRIARRRPSPATRPGRDRP
jgi:hypothetical protein